MSKVIVTGDIHGDFGAINVVINKKFPDVIIQCGDNAYFWPETNNVGKIKPGNCKVYLLPGNHSDWDQIESKIGRRGRDPVEIEQNVFYCPIGSTAVINERRFMFIGGADSIDKKYRTLGISWWKQELLNQEDIDFCLSTTHKIDIICSHTAPKMFNIADKINLLKIDDPSAAALDIIFEQLNPYAWFFGHFHGSAKGKVNQCEWRCLNMARDDGWLAEIFVKGEDK